MTAPMARLLVGLLVATIGVAAGDEGDKGLSDVARAAARFDYLLHCSGCHLPDGSGAPPEVPSLRGPMGALLATPEGRDYIARVPEVAQAPLADDALARVLNWVLLEFNAETLPTGFRPLSAAEVGVARVKILADPLRAREAIVGRYAGETATERP